MPPPPSVAVSGRKTQGGSNYDSVETDYNAEGLPSMVTVPYTGTAGELDPSDPNSVGTKTAYDALGLPLGDVCAAQPVERGARVRRGGGPVKVQGALRAEQARVRRSARWAVADSKRLAVAVAVPAVGLSQGGDGCPRSQPQCVRSRVTLGAEATEAFGKT